MLGMDEIEANSFCKKIRDSHLEHYLNKNITEFTKQKKEAVYTEKLKPIIISEQKFLKETYGSLKSPISDRSSSVVNILRAGEVASKQPELLDKVFETTNYINSQCKGVVSSLYNILSCYNNLNHINTELSRKIETHKAFGQPVHAEHERLRGNTIESTLLAIKKEQSLLADLNGNIDYHSSNKELMTKVELAYNQRENKDFSRLEILAKKSLEVGAETQETLLKKLQYTTDLKASYEGLDRAIEIHQINKQLSELDKVINESQTPKNILKAIEGKNSFLSSLDKNIKYPVGQEKLLEISKSVKILYSKQVPEQLDSLVKQSILLGTFSEKAMIDELKNTKNIEKTCQKLEVAIEAQSINKHLLKLATEKQEAKTPEKVMTIIKQEQEFLAGFKDRLKHPDYHNNNLITSIKNADDNMRTDNINHLGKLVTFLEKSSNNPSVISTLKSTNNLTGAYQDLLKAYQAKSINSINTTISALDSGKNITLDNKKFDCSIKFLDYLTKTRTHEYFPHKEVQKIQSKVIENQKQLQLSKGLDGMEL